TYAPRVSRGIYLPRASTRKYVPPLTRPPHCHSCQILLGAIHAVEFGWRRNRGSLKRPKITGNLLRYQLLIRFQNSRVRRVGFRLLPVNMVMSLTIGISWRLR